MWLWLIRFAPILTPMQHGARLFDDVLYSFRWNHAVATVLLVSAPSASFFRYIVWIDFLLEMFLWLMVLHRNLTPMEPGVHFFNGIS